MHYFILAVSKNHAQLFEVRDGLILPRGVDGMPTSMSEAWTGMERHEKSLQFHSTGNGTAGFHGQGGAKDTEEQEEDQYMKSLAKSIHTIVHSQHSPLIFAGVTEAYGMFKKFDQSGRLLDEYIQGSAEQMPMEDLKAKADPIVKAHMMKQAEQLIEEYGALLGTGRTSSDKHAIHDAAVAGKVDLLFMSEGHEAEAAEILQHVIDHRGRVALVESGKLPEGATIAAILRY